MDLLHKMALVVILSPLAAFVICILCGVFFGMRASRHRDPDAPYRFMVDVNPLNAAWFSDQLDEDGLAFQRKAFRFYLLALAFAVLFILGGVAVTAIR